MSQARPSGRRRALAAIAAPIWASLSVLSWVASPQAQEMPVPVDAQWALLSKILTFDRSLAARAGEELVVGLLYQGRYRPSLVARKESEEALSSIGRLADIRTGCVPIEMRDQADLEAALLKNKVDVLYVTPMRRLEIEPIAALSRARKIVTLTGVPRFVESGLAVGIGAKGGKPRIIINLPAARAEGIDFGSGLLKLAKIVE